MSRPALHLFAPFGIRAYHFTLGTPSAGLRREAAQSDSCVPGGRVTYCAFLIGCSILIQQHSMYFGTSGVQR